MKTENTYTRTDINKALKVLAAQAENNPELGIVLAVFEPVIKMIMDTFTPEEIEKTIDEVTVFYARKSIENTDEIMAHTSEYIWRMMHMRDIIRECEIVY